MQEALRLATNRPMRAVEMTEAGIPAWFSEMQQMIKKMETGHLLSMEVAKQCEQQPSQYAIPLLQQLVLEKVRSSALDSDNEQYQATSMVWQKVYQALTAAQQELAATANINPLMTYEYLFTLWQRAAIKSAS